jgi:energy-converting hydrogenase Eha subunit G
MKNLGIALIVIGIIMTVFTGFNIIIKKKVVDLGAVEITSDEKTPIYWSPIAGGIVAVAGALIFVVSRKKN